MWLFWCSCTLHNKCVRWLYHVSFIRVFICLTNCRYTTGLVYFNGIHNEHVIFFCTYIIIGNLRLFSCLSVFVHYSMDCCVVLGILLGSAVWPLSGSGLLVSWIVPLQQMIREDSSASYSSVCLALSANSSSRTSTLYLFPLSFDILLYEVLRQFHSIWFG